MKRIVTLLLSVWGLFGSSMLEAQTLQGNVLNLFGGPTINFLSTSSGPLRGTISSNSSNELNLSSYGNFIFNNPNLTTTYFHINTTNNNVGIGTNSSTAMLHHYYASTNNNLRREMSRWEWSGNSNLELSIFGDTHPSMAGWVQLAGYNNDVKLAFVTDAQATVQAGASTKGLFINNGNIGIGNINPNAPLQFANAFAARKIVLREVGVNDHQIDGIGTASGGILRYQLASTAGSHIFYAANSATADDALMTIQGNGNVAIGNIGPTHKLEILGSNNNHLALDGLNPGMQYNSGGATSNILVSSNAGYFMSTSKANDFIFSGVAGGDLAFSASTTATPAERLRITNAGNVGIGTTTPASMLHVNDVVQVTGSTTPVNTKAGLTAGENAAYIWLQSNTAKPIVLNPVVSTNSYVAVGFTPGTLNVPLGYKLAVKGKIICEELKVKYSGQWSDFVFAPSYCLPSLVEVEQHIKAHQHLPGVPSADEIAKEGYETGSMDATLLKKIEELTLYVIDLNKKYELLERENALLKETIDKK